MAIAQDTVLTIGPGHHLFCECERCDAYWEAIEASPADVHARGSGAEAVLDEDARFARLHNYAW